MRNFVSFSSICPPLFNKQSHSVPTPAALPHREPRCSCILFHFAIKTVTAHCVIGGSIFDTNLQNKTCLVNLLLLLILLICCCCGGGGGGGGGVLVLVRVRVRVRVRACVRACVYVSV